MRLYVGNNPVDATYYGNNDIKRMILYQGGAESAVGGESPLLLPNALPNSIYKILQYGKCEQSTTPAPNAPVDIKCNNGSLKLRHKSGLPLGYKLLDYVGSSGAAYIITNTKLASTDIIESEFRNSSTTGYGALYGIFAIGQSSAFYANQTYYGYNAANSKVDTDINVDTDWHTVRHDFVNGTLTIDNTTTTFTPFEFENTTNNAILARYYNNSYGYIWKGYIRKFKVTRNNEVICDLLPAKNSNDELGLYDLANNTFFTATTGSLSEGNEIDDYELIDGTPEEISIGGKNLTPQTASVADLFAVGDYKDTQDIITGDITRKVGITVLDGTEGWTENDTASTIRYRLRIDDAIGGTSRSAIMSSHFVYSSSGQDVGVAFLLSKYLYVVVDQTITTVEDFKTWLVNQYAAGTPVIVVYPLAEETTESVGTQEVYTNVGTNSVNAVANVSGITLNVIYLKEN